MVARRQTAKERQRIKARLGYSWEMAQRKKEACLTGRKLGFSPQYGGYYGMLIPTTVY